MRFLSLQRKRSVFRRYGDRAGSKSFVGFRFDEVKLPSGVTPEYLKQGTFIDEVKNLILYGNVGTGKTHLAIALGIETCRRVLKVGSFRMASLVNQLVDARKNKNLSKILAGKWVFLG